MHRHLNVTTLLVLGFVFNLTDFSQAALAAPVPLYGGGTQSETMEALSNKICSDLVNAQEVTGESSAKVIERNLLKHLAIAQNAANANAKITEFWNENFEQLICTVGGLKNRTPQHLLKRVIDMKLNSTVFYDFIFELDADGDIDNVNINVNAIEQTPNGPETVIDYIDAILSDPKNKTSYVFSEIKDLRDGLIEEFGAKRASELIQTQASK